MATKRKVKSTKIKVGKNTKNGWQILARKGTSWRVKDYAETRKAAEKTIKKYL